MKFRVFYKGILVLLFMFLSFLGALKAQSSKFSLIFDNDILNLVNQTDRYYTNGIEIGFYHRNLNSSFINLILIGGGKNSIQTTGITFNQKMYTPANTHTSELQAFDRPYAGVSYISQERISVNPKWNYRIKSELSLGVVGKYSGGEFFQNFIHGLTINSENANGWSHQIKNDLIFNYNLSFEKGIVNLPFMQLNLIGNSKFGTLQNSLSGKAHLGFGILEPQYQTVFGRSISITFAFKIFTEMEYGYMFYDATLEGGIFNQGNEYTIGRDSVSRRRLLHNTGIQICYKKVMLETGRISSSPEFISAKSHAWGYIKFALFFN